MRRKSVKEKTYTLTESQIVELCKKVTSNLNNSQAIDEGFLSNLRNYAGDLAGRYNRDRDEEALENIKICKMRFERGRGEDANRKIASDFGREQLVANGILMQAWPGIDRMGKIYVTFKLYNINSDDFMNQVKRNNPDFKVGSKVRLLRTFDSLGYTGKLLLNISYNIDDRMWFRGDYSSDNDRDSAQTCRYITQLVNSITHDDKRFRYDPEIDDTDPEDKWRTPLRYKYLPEEFMSSIISSLEAGKTIHSHAGHAEDYRL